MFHSEQMLVCPDPCARRRERRYVERRSGTQFDRVAARDQYGTCTDSGTYAGSDCSTRTAARDRTDDRSKNRTDTGPRNGLCGLARVTDRTFIVHRYAVTVSGNNRIDHTGEPILT